MNQRCQEYNSITLANAEGDRGRLDSLKTATNEVEAEGGLAVNLPVS